MGIGLLSNAKAAKHQELKRIFPEVNGKIRQAYLVYRKTSYTPKQIVETVKALEVGAKGWADRMNDWVYEERVENF